MLHARRYDHSDDAPWVVFIHGAGGSSSIWHQQIRAFRARYNVLMVDLRGHGGSQLSEASARRLDYTFEAVSREVVDVLDREQIEAAHFVGISLGGIVIRTIAELEPHRVLSMTLGGAIVRLDLRSRMLVGAGNVFKRVVPYLWLYKLFAWIIMPRAAHKESRSLFVREARKLAQREFVRWFRLTTEVTPLLRLYRERELDTPTLYVMGDQDHLFLPPARKLAEEHQNSELEVIEDCGHVVNVDQPEAFNQLTMAFIDRITEQTRTPSLV
jgi:pimeloyl-ACP methyl ester carboxylesterase